jgi:hypothetical protein
MTASSDIRELAHRATDGVEVALLWYPSNDVVSVQVFDAKAGEAFELVLGDGDRPLDVFHHPYAYAAPRPRCRAADRRARACRLARRRSRLPHARPAKGPRAT